MPIRDSQTFTFRPTGTVDAVDATNGPAGGLTSCQNLVPSPSSPGSFAPRPAAIKAADLTSINAAGFISGFEVVGTIVYGLIASSRFPSYDEPFAYDLAAGALLPVSGVTANSIPSSISAGAWNPPTIFAGAGSRVMVTHSGFAFNVYNNYVGWFDVSSFNTSLVSGNTVSGSNILSSLHTPVGNSAPILSGVMPGMTITGTGIPANTTVLSSINGTFSLSTTGNTTSGSTAVVLPSTTNVAIGMSVTGPNIPTGAYILSISGSTVNISQLATATATGSAIIITGGGSIAMSNNATVTSPQTSGVSVIIKGGTPTNPQWAAGNLNTNPLNVVPTTGAAFNGRAYYGVGPYLVFSDPLNPTQVTQSIQALLIGDLTTITAVSALPLTSQLTGGIQQSLTVYKGGESFYQITGDAATGNLALNAVTGSVGTLAPGTITQTPLGVAMICADGLRFLELTGVQTDRIGADGTGVCVPFLNAVIPSRMNAAYAENVFRVSVQSANDAAGRTFEYWYDLTTRQWSGPHTFACSIIEAYPAGGGFLLTPVGVLSSLWFSDVIPKSTSTYTENGTPLVWTMETTLIPDNEQLAFNQVVETAIQLSSPASNPVNVTAVAGNGTLLDLVTVQPDPSPTSALWGSAVWGAFNWGASAGTFRRYPVYWSLPLVFRQAKLRMSGASAPGQLIGDTFLRYQIVNYGLDPQP